MRNTDAPFEFFARRNFRVYELGMNATLPLKLQDIVPWIVPPPPGRDGIITDEGCGTGKMLAMIARTFPDALVIGRDLSKHFVATTLRAIEGLPNTMVEWADLSRTSYARESLTTKIYSSVWHEIYSYRWYDEEALRETLARSFQELRPGGRIIIRDGVRPKHERWALWLDPTPKRLPRNSDRIEALSEREIFFQFAQDFFPARKVRYDVLTSPEWRVILSSGDAYEFLMKKDYRENWEGEIREVYGVWTAQEFRAELEDAGFHVLCCRPFQNPWIIQNRLEKTVKLFRVDTDGSMHAVPFPATNILVVAQRP